MPFHLYHFFAFIYVCSGSAADNAGCSPNRVTSSGRVDLPGGRKVHEKPMVRLGGVSIFLGTLTSLLLVWVHWAVLLTPQVNIWPPPEEFQIWGVTIGGLAFFLIGLTDDLFGLSAFSRLLMQVIVATMAWHVGVSIDFLTIPFYGLTQLPFYVSLPVTVVWLVGMANAINWIDGLDGLAAGVSGIAAIIMLVVSTVYGPASCCPDCGGFSRWFFRLLAIQLQSGQDFYGRRWSLFYGLYPGGGGGDWLVKTVRPRRCCCLT
jgi:UDP-GlcNAc:undecaprenyl-phosphate GlcNAc-1-phosphate transferase